MTELSRVVRLSDFAVREGAENEGTRFGRFPISELRLDVRSVFNRFQAELADQVQARPERGWLFAAVGAGGIGGSLWLAATSEFRSGSIGRHACVDLFLPGEKALSLRHLLALAHGLDDGLRLHLVDLCSSGGLTTETHEPVQAVDADGPLLLRVPGGLLLCLPTGVRLPWDPDAHDPFASLAPRRVLRSVMGKQRAWRPTRGEHAEATLRAGPIDASSRLCLPGEAPAGQLVVQSSEGRVRLAVGFSALDAGVLLGRDPRCVGAAVLSDPLVSRVHAILLRRDGTTLLSDCGSTNGIQCEGEEISCAPIRPGAVYFLTPHTSIRWMPLD